MTHDASLEIYIRGERWDSLIPLCLGVNYTGHTTFRDILHLRHRSVCIALKIPTEH